MRWPFRIGRTRQWHPTPVLLPGKSRGRRSLVGCSPWGHWELDTTERLPFHFSLSCIGEGNGSPLQCSCLENPRDGGAWWAAVYGVAQSRTQLKQLSSSRLHLIITNVQLYYPTFQIMHGVLTQPKFCCCSVAKSCRTLCKPMDCSMPGFSVGQYLKLKEWNMPVYHLAVAI